MGQRYNFGGEKASQLKRRLAAAQRDHFAELLSRGMEIPVIRERMGLTNRRAQQIMLRIRKDLGPQAR